jgi:hypothetical protein
MLGIVESSIDVTFPTASPRQKSDHDPATRRVKTFTTQNSAQTLR